MPAAQDCGGTCATDAWRRWAGSARHVEFVLYPSRYLHPSWKPFFFTAETGTSTWSVPAAHAHLSRHIERKAGLPALEAPDISHPAWQLALLPADMLAALVRHAGVVLSGMEIRRVIGKASARQIIDQIGPSLYHFGLERAGLIFDRPLDIALPCNAQGLFTELDRHLQQLGCRLLAQGFSEVEPALWSRARLKLDRGLVSAALDPLPQVSTALAFRILLATKRELH